MFSSEKEDVSSCFYDAPVLEVWSFGMISVVGK